jgi:uncharacterized membrane protein
VLYLIHPATVHFVVAFLLAGALAEAWGMWREREALASWGGRMVVLGGLAAVPAVAAGYLAANTAPLPDGAEEMLEWHERSGLVLAAAVLAALLWKAWCGGSIPRSQRAAYVALLAVIVTLVVTAAWLGGTLVYGLGVGVDRASAALEHRAERVAGDLGILAEPSHRVLVPALAERDVYPQAVAGLDQDRAQLAVDAEQHLELVPVSSEVELAHEA